jgi:hypothetical protein
MVAGRHRVAPVSAAKRIRLTARPAQKEFRRRRIARRRKLSQTRTERQDGI